MSQVHWGLVVLAFVLGLVLTLALMVRPVRARVPVAATAARAAGTVMGSTPHPVKKRRPAKKGPRPHPAKKAGAKGSPPKRRPALKQPPAKTGMAAKGTGTRRIPPGKKASKAKAGTAKGAVTKRIPVAKVVPAAKVPAKPFAPYGPGSLRADPDGGGPPGWLVKGRSDTRLYYTPDDPSYDTITAQVWFQDEAAASRAFFTAWAKSSRKK